MTAGLRLSRFRACSPALRTEGSDRPVRVVLSTRTAQVRVIDDGLWQHLQENGAGSLDSVLRDELCDVELLVPDDEDELATVLRRSNDASATEDELYMVVQPTAACQLGCHYCGQEHAAARLTEADQDAFVRRVASRLRGGSYQSLRIGWFGAEPLLGMNVIRRMTPRLRAVASGAGCDYNAKIVTNGLALDGDTAHELAADLGIGFFEVTLDGPPGFHDTRRFWKNGNPSFDRIFRNLVDVARRDDVPAVLSVRCNVDRSNAAGVRPLLDLLAAVGLQDRIRFYVAPIHSWGNDAHLGSLDAEDFARWEVDWLAYMLTLGFEPPLLPAVKPIVCMATTRDSELADAYGNLFNCTEVSYVPAYGRPNRFRLGDLAGGAEEGDRSVFGGFNERIERGEVPCHQCRMLPACGGACPKAWLEGHAPCPSSKHNIESRLVLAYLRGLVPEQERPPVVGVDEALSRVSDPPGTAGGTWTPVSLGPARR